MCRISTLNKKNGKNNEKAEEKIIVFSKSFKNISDAPKSKSLKWNSQRFPFLFLL